MPEICNCFDPKRVSILAVFKSYGLVGPNIWPGADTETWNQINTLLQNGLIEYPEMFW